MLRWFTSRNKRAQSRQTVLHADEVVPSEASMAELQAMIQRRLQPGLVVSKGRPPTDDEILMAAWGNLAAEDPSVTIEDVRQGLAKRRSPVAT